MRQVLQDAHVSQGVVAAVITSGLGMLVTWQNDKCPPVGVLSGQIESDESPAEPMARECREEAGVLVAAEGEIGRRGPPAHGPHDDLRQPSS